MPFPPFSVCPPLGPPCSHVDLFHHTNLCSRTCRLPPDRRKKGRGIAFCSGLFSRPAVPLYSSSRLLLHSLSFLKRQGLDSFSAEDAELLFVICRPSVDPHPQLPTSAPPFSARQSLTPPSVTASGVRILLFAFRPSVDGLSPNRDSEPMTFSSFRYRARSVMIEVIPGLLQLVLISQFSDCA